MAVSQNGWSAFTSSSGLVSFPWVTGRVRPGDAYTVLNYLARRFNAEVEGIEAWQSWGWNYRPVRGAVVLSNHSSGTAVDFNATRHALGARGTFTAAQVAAIRRILAALGGVVRWGGDYTSRPDEMHFEISAGPARVAEVARTLGGLVSNPIGGGSTVNVPTIPGRPAPIAPEEDMQADEREALFQIRDVLGARGGLNTGQNASVLAHVQESVRLVRGLPNAVWMAPVVGVSPYDGSVEAHSAADWLTVLGFRVSSLVSAPSGGGGVDPKALAAAIAESLPADLARVVRDDLINRLKD